MLRMATLLAAVMAMLNAGWALANPSVSSPHNLESVPGQYVVQWANSNHPDASSLHVLENLNQHGTALVEITGPRSALGVAQLSQSLVAAGVVKTLEPNFIYRTQTRFAQKMPNDPRFDELFGLHNEGGTGGTADADIDAPEAWAMVTGSRDVLIAVIDTGIDYTHEDLVENYWANPGETGTDADGNDKATNGIDDDGNGYIDDHRGWDFVNNDNDPMDDNRHGTHCAGTIGAKGDNGIGVAGVAWDVSFVGVKFLSGSGGGTLADAIKAIDYATIIGVDIMSNSWGGGGYSAAMEDSIRRARDAGILFVAAAGNSGRDNDRSPTYPSGYEVENVISVTAIDHNDEMSTWANYGQNTVHLAAPGIDVLSTVPGNAYEKLSGTSMATPHVSGALALIKTAFPDDDMAKLKARLLTGVDPLDNLTLKTQTGGRLNVAASVEEDSVPPGAVTITEQTSAGLVSAAFTWTITGDDGDSGLASSYELRYSSAPISDEATWNEATVPSRFTFQQDEEAALVTAEISGLTPGFAGYVAVRALDNVRNLGPLSASFAFALSEAVALKSWTADSLSGVRVEGTWGLQELADGNTVYSDTPSGDYSNYANMSLTLNSFEVPAANDLILTFRSKHTFASNGDQGRVQIAYNGEVQFFELVNMAGGSSDWQDVSIPLYEVMPEGTTEFKVRFLFTSDYRGTADGWLVDDIKIMGPGSY